MSHPMSLCLWSACMADVLNVSTFTMLVSCGHGRWSVGWAVLRARADFVLSAQYLAQWGSWAVTGLQNSAKSYSINIRCFMLMLWRRYYCKHREDYPLNISVFPLLICFSLWYLTYQKAEKPFASLWQKLKWCLKMILCEGLFWFSYTRD